ncbi:TPA: helix-turn-helix transcriptional regulator [Clostridioides difficile]|uniref:helix-turn-helix domain-containing protein n=1 Tax=Clostridioides difficile TaxID=1496 RepID=UPI00097FDD0D|nr:helix-turn-helix transcriptional regulator [Clostridioides difficile]MDI3114915.1 helix-turn-helix transcriptional regulator [Clostridioides difficile]TQX31277.1 XRE family transcriptional regulator [Clostridioides difficile]SJR58922.1 Predicted transcriptional regulator [Clostridioides difficile]HBF0728733.1 helix-turn-helix transcriptional regulator [Clostridioides difficile]HBF6827886.1 helix-turn-helix transcriptional regulator [Clostridioides difficile]
MLKKLRKERGMTQNELAEKANYSRAYISDLENKRYKNINISTIIDLSLALEIDFLELCRYYYEEELRRRKLM